MGCPCFQTKKVVASIRQSQFQVRHYLLENLPQRTQEKSFGDYTEAAFLPFRMEIVQLLSVASATTLSSVFGVL